MHMVNPYIHPCTRFLSCPSSSSCSLHCDRRWPKVRARGEDTPQPCVVWLRHQTRVAYGPHGVKGQPEPTRHRRGLLVVAKNHRLRACVSRTTRHEPTPTSVPRTPPTVSMKVRNEGHDQQKGCDHQYTRPLQSHFDVPDPIIFFIYPKKQLRR